MILQVCNHKAILASITYKHTCITVYEPFFLKTLNCFGACNIIFARAVLLNSIYAAEGSDTTKLNACTAAGNIKIKISQLKIGLMN